MKKTKKASKKASRAAEKAAKAEEAAERASEAAKRAEMAAKVTRECIHTAKFCKTALTELLTDLNAIIGVFKTTESAYSCRRVFSNRKKQVLYGAYTKLLSRRGLDNMFDMCTVTADPVFPALLKFTVGDTASRTAKFLTFVVNSLRHTKTDCVLVRPDPNHGVYLSTKIAARHQEFLSYMIAMLPASYSDEGTRKMELAGEMVVVFRSSFNPNANPKPLSGELQELEGQIRHVEMCNTIIRLCNAYIDSMKVKENPSCANAVFFTGSVPAMVNQSGYLFSGTPVFNPLFAELESISGLVRDYAKYLGLCDQGSSQDPGEYAEIIRVIHELPPCLLSDSRTIVFTDDALSLVARAPEDTLVRDYEDAATLPHATASIVAHLFGFFRANIDFDIAFKILVRQMMTRGNWESH